MAFEAKNTKEVNAANVVSALYLPKIYKTLNTTNGIKNLTAIIASLMDLLVYGVIFSPFLFGYVSITSMWFFFPLGILMANQLWNIIQIFPYTSNELSERKTEAIAQNFALFSSNSRKIPVILIPILPVLFLLYINEMFVYFALVFGFALLQSFSSIISTRYVGACLIWFALAYDEGRFETNEDEEQEDDNKGA